ncbi:MAG: NYN domain-containing protein [Candidatus Eisenbacteria bacterium]|uniref:NYN domain-containing protein n=1 Tax=Eiseniibacteriota bacterium TaxID=2212470 RepID=A0A538U9F6_UNCEI|nr:MAG: NYN domain-containing protein [Candidatus Eisenbacteria bacterium]
MRRTTFLIDGFNLYHSLCVASLDLGRVSTKWLDIRSMCASYLAQIGGGAALQDIFYFSALAAYRLALDPDVTKRHRTYIECLRATVKCSSGISATWP